jgi:CRP/FNR family transcriptional regulator, cyclic AMP receptor protein
MQATELGRFPFLAGLSDEERAALAAHLVERSYAPGETIFAQGDPGDAVLLVTGGEVELSLTVSGQQLPLGRLGTGAYFGEMALLDGGPRSANAVATSPVRLAALAREPWFEAILGSEAGARVLLAELASRLRSTNALLGERASRNVLEEMDRKLTLADRLAEKVARLNGSWANVAVLLALTFGWAAVNVFLDRPFDPYPYVFFNLLLAVLVAIQGPLLMMSQNREAREERARAEADFRVNLKNEVAIDRLSRDVVTLRETVLRLAEGRGARGGRAATPPPA